MKRIATLTGLGSVLALVFSAAALAAPAAIFTADSTGQRAFNDPIVSPGVRSAHEHCFYGVRPVNQTETEASLKDGDHSSTWVITHNRTAIWIPCVYENGIPVQPWPSAGKQLLAYYQSTSATECLPPENGAQGVSREVTWRGELNSGTITSTIPANSVDGSLVEIVFFRPLRDLGLACFPQVKIYIRFNVGKGPIGNITLGGPVAGVDGAAGPETAHADYKYAHDDGFFRRFLDQCVIPGRACGTNPVL